MKRAKTFLSMLLSLSVRAKLGPLDHVEGIVSGRDLRGADLSRFDLEGADFSNSELTDVNFEETTLPLGSADH